MYKGFYNLTSAMLTHQHNLNVIGNNIVNISTSGYKQERYVEIGRASCRERVYTTV